MAAAERRLGLSFPRQVSGFYAQNNGLVTVEPAVEVIRVSELLLDEDSRMDFCFLDRCHPISFACSRHNAAEQWDIVSGETGHLITLTMASFWSNKLWKWIDQQVPVWRESLY